MVLPSPIFQKIPRLQHLASVTKKIKVESLIGLQNGHINIFVRARDAVEKQIVES
jgi:hypothetical protein